MLRPGSDGPERQTLVSCLTGLLSSSGWHLLQ